MKLLKHYFRAFKRYNKDVLSQKECVKLNNSIKNSYEGDDKLETLRAICKIEEEWIIQIETYLPYVMKAIAEERQFITNEGSVVPIEKVRKVSKATISHLAKHSNMIRHLPNQGEDIIPDSLYMEEKLSDFTVYENKFLYLLLQNLNFFVSTRLKKILEIGKTYKSWLNYKKNVSLQKRNMTFEMSFTDEVHDDENSLFDIETIKLVDRIRKIEFDIEMLLKTPLMQILSQVPLIKPPITKTNVLKMNTNFRNSLTLYDFIATYNKDGFTIEEKRQIYSPLISESTSEFAEIMSLTAFLSYQYGNNLTAKLESEYLSELEAEKEKQKEESVQKLEDLKRRLSNKEISPYDYIIELESVNKSLQEDRKSLKALKEEYEVLTNKYSALDREFSILNNMLKETEKRENEIYIKLETIEETHRKEIENLNHEHELLVRELKASYETQITNLNEEFTKKLAKLEEDYKQEYKKITEDYNAYKKSATDEYNKIKKQLIFVRAEFNGLRSKYGIITSSEDFTSQERFSEIEEEYNAFKDFFATQWKKTKKRIRKEVLSKKQTTSQVVDVKQDKIVKQSEVKKDSPIIINNKKDKK